MASFLEQMSSWCRLILYDRRGSGASDAFPDGAHPTWEEWVEDIAAVMDAAGSERAAVVASADAGPSGALFAATFPGGCRRWCWSTRRPGSSRRRTTRSA